MRVRALVSLHIQDTLFKRAELFQYQENDQCPLECAREIWRVFCCYDVKLYIIDIKVYNMNLYI